MWKSPPLLWAKKNKKCPAVIEVNGKQDETLWFDMFSSVQFPLFSPCQSSQCWNIMENIKSIVRHSLCSELVHYIWLHCDPSQTNVGSIHWLQGPGVFLVNWKSCVSFFSRWEFSPQAGLNECQEMGMGGGMCRRWYCPSVFPVLPHKYISREQNPCTPSDSLAMPLWFNMIAGLVPCESSSVQCISQPV